PDVCSPLLLTNSKIKQHYDVYIVTVRGYKKDLTYGNCVDRCAIDLHDFIQHFNIHHFIAMGHSIGVAIWWQYMLTYGQESFAQFILLDEMTALLQNPANSSFQNTEYGSIVPLNDLFVAYNTLIQGNKEATDFRNTQILTQLSLVFQANHPKIVTDILEKVNNYGFKSTAQILYSNQTNNWIDKLLNNKIYIPTYLFCGEKSVVPYQSVFYQKQFYTDSRIHIFEGLSSSHFAWMENYHEFNELINDFL
ncbi:alpha/beta hydrolase, partial [Runella sp.]|uniref:alpha/beta fold hydrolase n=1 Tax=Runella sp. TaxID=1960881 RepID=UPI0030178C61